MALWQRSPDHARGRSAVPFCVSYLWMMSTAFRINRKRPPTKVSGLLVVEVTRLELAASASRTQRSTKLSHTSMAARLGFEPRQTESESVVLPLHNSASLVTSSIYYIQPHGKSQAFSREMPIFFRAYRSRARSATESRTNAIPASLDGVTASRKIPTPSTAATTGSRVAMMAACPACTPASPAV